MWKNAQYRKKKIILADLELHTIIIVHNLIMDYGRS